MSVGVSSLVPSPLPSAFVKMADGSGLGIRDYNERAMMSLQKLLIVSRDTAWGIQYLRDLGTKMMLLIVLISVFVAYVLAEGAKLNSSLDAKTQNTSTQWSVKLQVEYEYGMTQTFESALDGSVSTGHDSYLIGHGVNSHAEPNYDRVTYRHRQFHILYDAPLLNIINEADGTREHRSLPAGCSPRLVGLSSGGPSVIVYVVCIEAGHCESYHEPKVVLFSTSYCEPGKDTWCENPIGPITLPTYVPCSEKLPRMAFAPLNTDVMILLDSYPESEHLACIIVQNGQSSCRLGGGLPKNRLDIRYFYNVSTQETLMQVKAVGSSNSYSQHKIDPFGSIHKLSSDNTENLPCPMLSPTVFNCTSRLKFMNGSLVHLTDAIGEPQGFQTCFGFKGVAYVKLSRKETAVGVLRPSLDGGSQVLDNSSWICSNNIRVKPIYVMNNGAVIVITRCLPNGDSIFQVYLYDVEEACYVLVPSHHAMHLDSGQFGRVLNVHAIGQLFLVEGANVPLVPTVLPPGNSTAVTATLIGIGIGSIIFLGLVVAAIVFVMYVFCRLRKGRKWRLCCANCRGINNGDRQGLLHDGDGDNRSLEGEIGGQEVERLGSNEKGGEQVQKLEQDNKCEDERRDGKRGQGAELNTSDKLTTDDVTEYSGKMATGFSVYEPGIVSIDFGQSGTSTKVQWSAGRDAASKEKTSISHSEHITLTEDADLSHGIALTGKGSMPAADGDSLMRTYGLTPSVPMHQTNGAGASETQSLTSSAPHGTRAPKALPVVSEFQGTVPLDKATTSNYSHPTNSTAFSPSDTSCLASAPTASDTEVCTSCRLPKMQRHAYSPVACQCGQPAMHKEQRGSGDVLRYTSDGTQLRPRQDQVELDSADHESRRNFDQEFGSSEYNLPQSSSPLESHTGQMQGPVELHPVPPTAPTSTGASTPHASSLAPAPSTIAGATTPPTSAPSLISHTGTGVPIPPISTGACTPPTSRVNETHSPLKHSSSHASDSSLAGSVTKHPEDLKEVPSSSESPICASSQLLTCSSDPSCVQLATAISVPAKVPGTDPNFGLTTPNGIAQEQDPTTDSHANKEVLTLSCTASGQDNTSEVVLPSQNPPVSQDQDESLGSSDEQRITAANEISQAPTTSNSDPHADRPPVLGASIPRLQVLQYPPSSMAGQNHDSQSFGTVESVEESGSFFAQLAMGSARLTPLEQVALRPSAPGQ